MKDDAVFGALSLGRNKLLILLKYKVAVGMY